MYQSSGAHPDTIRKLAQALEVDPPELLTEAMKAISPPEARESPETLSDAAGDTAPPPEAEEPAEPRPWWRRLFGG